MAKNEYKFKTDAASHTLTIEGLDFTSPDAFVKSVKGAGGRMIRMSAEELGFKPETGNDASAPEGGKPTSEDVAEGDTAYDAALKMGMQSP